MSAKFWTNVAVAMESARGSSIPLSAITKADPAVATYTGGVNPSNGDFVALSVQGMNQVDQRVVRVANVNTGAKTFEFEGVDSTPYNTFSSGSFAVLTFGSTMATAVGVNSSGGEPEFADTTTIHNNVRSRVPTVVSPFSINFESQWDPNDTFLKAAKSAADALTVKGCKITYSDGTICVFIGYVSCSLLPTGNAQEVVKTSVGFESQGRPSYY